MPYLVDHEYPVSQNVLWTSFTSLSLSSLMKELDKIFDACSVYIGMRIMFLTFWKLIIWQQWEPFLGEWVYSSASATLRKYHRLGHKQQTLVYHSSWRLGSPRSRCWHIWSLVTALSPACKWPSSHCILMWWESESSDLSSSSYKDANPITGAPPSWPQENLTTSQKLYLQISSHSGLGLQHMNLGVHNIQSLTVGFRIHQTRFAGYTCGGCSSWWKMTWYGDGVMQLKELWSQADLNSNPAFRTY